MHVSQKCQYALRALLELAKHRDRDEPTSVADIAEVQKIPPRFLEQILSQLKQGNFVTARRGARGGYFLNHAPDALTMGRVIRFIDGPLYPVACVNTDSQCDCDLYGACGFLSTWDRVRKAVEDIYDNTSFEDLLKEEAEAGRYVPDFTI